MIVGNGDGRRMRGLARHDDLRKGIEKALMGRTTRMSSLQTMSALMSIPPLGGVGTTNLHLIDILYIFTVMRGGRKGLRARDSGEVAIQVVSNRQGHAMCKAKRCRPAMGTGKSEMHEDSRHGSLAASTQAQRQKDKDDVATGIHVGSVIAACSHPFPLAKPTLRWHLPKQEPGAQAGIWEDAR